MPRRVHLHRAVVRSRVSLRERAPQGALSLRLSQDPVASLKFSGSVRVFTAAPRAGVPSPRARPLESRQRASDIARRLSVSEQGRGASMWSHRSEARPEPVSRDPVECLEAPRRAPNTPQGSAEESSGGQEAGVSDHAVIRSHRLTFDVPPTVQHLQRPGAAPCFRGQRRPKL